MAAVKTTAAVLGNFWRALWQARHFVYASIGRDIRSRYSNTVLGPFWVLIQPLAMIMIYTLVFSKVMHSRLPGSSGAYAYSLHLCAGLLPWMFFSDMINRLQGMYVENGNLLKKMSFPKQCLSAIALGISSFNFIIFSALFLLFCLLTGYFPFASIAAALPVIVLQTALALAIGNFLAVANVYFRDIGHMVGLLLQFGFWFTPIVYPFDVLPAWAKEWIAINPMVGIVRFYQHVFMLNQSGEWQWLLPALLWTAAFILLAVLTYRRHGKDMCDEL